MDTSYKNSSMNKLALGMMSTQGLDKAEDVWQLSTQMAIYVLAITWSITSSLGTRPSKNQKEGLVNRTGWKCTL